MFCLRDGGFARRFMGNAARPQGLFRDDAFAYAERAMTNFPQFGHSRRGDFLLADGIDHVNHGSYGATPRLVLEAARAWQERMEADPSSFFRTELPGQLRRAAERVARFLGG